MYAIFFLPLHRNYYTIMKEMILSTRVMVCNEQELDATQQTLVAKAKAMTEQAYSPYSGFSVGAAALVLFSRMP